MSTYFHSAVQEAQTKNTGLLHLGIALQNHYGMLRHYGRRVVEDMLNEIRVIVTSCFRVEDRVAVDFSRGQIHVFLITGDQFIKERIRKLDGYLRGKSFFVGEEVMAMEFVYGLAKFPDDGRDLETLKNKIDVQVRCGGLDALDLPLDGAA